MFNIYCLISFLINLMNGTEISLLSLDSLSNYFWLLLLYQRRQILVQFCLKKNIAFKSNKISTLQIQ